MTLALQLLGALIALPKIGALIEGWIQGIIAWYLARQTAETLTAIADAAALGARAQSDEDRYHVSEAWQKALSRPRVSP